MAVTIEIPTAFRRFTDGTPKLDCNAATIAEALNILTAQFPGLSRHVRDDNGQIRQFLNVYLNEEDIRFLGGEDCAVKEGDKVLLVPSIAGGTESLDAVQSIVSTSPTCGEHKRNYGVPAGLPAMVQENARKDDAVRSMAGSTVE
jgi:molybdopterin converting factor small subunit